MHRARHLPITLVTSEAFTKLRCEARYLAVALAWLADDWGLFEWSHHQIAARLAPGCSLDVEAALDELCDSGIVRCYTVARRRYGAIRGFCTDQRVRGRRTPTLPCPPEIAAFTGALEAYGRRAVERHWNEALNGGFHDPDPHDHPPHPRGRRTPRRGERTHAATGTTAHAANPTPESATARAHDGRSPTPVANPDAETMSSPTNARTGDSISASQPTASPTVNPTRTSDPGSTVRPSAASAASAARRAAANAHARTPYDGDWWPPGFEPDPGLLALDPRVPPAALRGRTTATPSRETAQPPSAASPRPHAPEPPIEDAPAGFVSLGAALRRTGRRMAEAALRDRADDDRETDIPETPAIADRRGDRDPDDPPDDPGSGPGGGPGSREAARGADADDAMADRTAPVHAEDGARPADLPAASLPSAPAAATSDLFGGGPEVDPPVRLRPRRRSRPKVDDALVTAAVAIWNEICGEEAGLPRVKSITVQRRAALRKRLERDCRGDLRLWAEYCQKIAASSFCRGANDRGWRANIDFALRPSTFHKVVEGNFDDREPIAPSWKKSASEIIDEMIEEERRRRRKKAGLVEIGRAADDAGRNENARAPREDRADGSRRLPRAAP